MRFWGVVVIYTLMGACLLLAPVAYQNSSHFGWGFGFSLFSMLVSLVTVGTAIWDAVLAQQELSDLSGFWRWTRSLLMPVAALVAASTTVVSYGLGFNNWYYGGIVATLLLGSAAGIAEQKSPRSESDLV